MVAVQHCLILQLNPSGCLAIGPLHNSVIRIPGDVEGKVIGTAQSQYKANQGSLAAIELRNHVVTLIS